MGEGNGTPVMWRELNLLRETIDQKFEGLEDDIKEIKALLADRKHRWRAWGPPLVAALVSAGIALPVAFFH